MKIFNIAVVMLIISLSYLYAQGMPPGDFSKGFERIEQMENAKLIQVLNLSEENAVRFFARRKEFRQKQRNLLNRRFELMDKIEELVKSNDKENSPVYREKLDELVSIDLELAQENKNFYKSLGNILTQKQILKLLLFEDRFRREIRETLTRRNNRPRQGG